jgi:hypothetical protein
MYYIDQTIKRELDTRWAECQPLWQQWQYEADLDTKMATGQQDYWNNFYNVNYRNQKLLMFNKILRLLNMTEGYQRKNRMATICSARETGSEETADQFTKILSWCMDQDDTYEKISDTFAGANITGLNLLNVWMDFREDPENGSICTSRLPFNSFIMDPYWTKADLSDCDYIWTRRYMGQRQITSLFPDIKKQLPTMNQGYGAKDGRFQFLAQNWYNYENDMYAYDEYWTRDYRKVRKLVDRATGEIVDWKGTREQFRLLKRYNPNVEIVEAMKPSVKLQILVNDHLVYEERAPYGIDRYPFVPFTTYMYPEVQNYAYRYQGIVRNVRDSQVMLNKSINHMLDMFHSQVQSGIIAEEDALVNPEDAYKQGPGSVLFTKAGRLNAVQPIQPPQIPQSLFELQGMFNNEIMEIAGGTDELFGQSEDKSISGFLTQLRMGAGLVSMQNIFDRLNQSQRLLGDLFIDLAQANFGEAKIRSIINEEPTEEFRSQDFKKYKCVVEEGTLTSTQKQLQFVQALQLKQMGIPVPTSYLLEQTTFQGKKKLMEAIQQEEQQASQMQQAQAMADLQQTQLLSRSLEAKAQSDFAGAAEKKTKAIANIGMAKRSSGEAVLDKAKAALDNAKALKELQGMDQSRLLNLSTFILDFQDRQSMAVDGNEEDSAVKAGRAASEVNQIEEVSKPMQLKQQEQESQQPQSLSSMMQEVS